MFINFSNHSVQNWSEAQLEAAKIYGEVMDFSFPTVMPQSDEGAIKSLADRVAAEIIEMRPEAVMCSGEFTLTFSIVKRLQKAGIKVVVACTERIATEEIEPNGNVKKTAVFKFVKFREYEKL